MVRRRRALSPVISTAILTAAMLVIVIGVLGFATNLFAIQTQQAEFGQAQNILINFADGIDSVSSREGASTYVRFNLRAGGPVWVQNYDTIKVNVTIGNQTNYVIPIQGNVGAFTYRGGSQIGTGSFTVLRGISSSAVLNNAYPLGRVYLSQSNGAIITLDYDRIGVNDLGLFNVSKSAGGGFDYIDIVQITLVNLTRGNFSGGSTAFVEATNYDVIINNYRINYNRSLATVPSYNLNITVTLASRGGFEDTYVLPIQVGNVFDGYTGSLQPVDVVLVVLMPQVRVDYIGG